MGYTYAILGSGMQGTCIAYDLAKNGEADRILMGDMSLEQATRNSERVNKLVGKQVCEPKQVDALNESELEGFLSGVNVLVSCVPYWMHPKIAPVAVKAGANMIDLGGDTTITMETMKCDEQAKAAGVTVVPDCGLAPGLVNSLGTHLMSKFDEVDTVRMYCGGLPQNPRPPFNYKLVFNVEGLVAEYTDDAIAVRGGKLAHVPTLTDLEEIQWPELGKMEAFVTSGGTSTAPYSFEGKLDTYEYKTIRFPGHCERMRIFMDYGFWGEDKVSVDGVEMRPRELFHKLMSEGLRDDQDKDQILVRAFATGKKDGVEGRHQIDIWDKQDPETGFSAMERMTGFPAAIYAHEIAKGNVEKGCVRYELAIPGTTVVEGLKARGINLTES